MLSYLFPSPSYNVCSTPQNCNDPEAAPYLKTCKAAVAFKVHPLKSPLNNNEECAHITFGRAAEALAATLLDARHPGVNLMNASPAYTGQERLAMITGKLQGDWNRPQTALSVLLGAPLQTLC